MLDRQIEFGNNAFSFVKELELLKNDHDTEIRALGTVACGSVERSSTDMTDNNTNRNNRLPGMRIVLRRLRSRIDRLAYDFHHYTQRLLSRFGLTDGCVKAKRHDGKLVNVRFQVNGSGRNAGQRRPVAKRRRNYSPQDLQFALHSRLSRVTKGCNIRFGRIMVAVSAGDITCVHFTDLIRPSKEDFSRYFDS